MLLYLCYHFLFYLNTNLYNSFSLQQISGTGKAKTREQLGSTMPATKKAFGLLGNHRVDFSKENEILKNKIGCYD